MIWSAPHLNHEAIIIYTSNVQRRETLCNNIYWQKTLLNFYYSIAATFCSHPHREREKIKSFFVAAIKTRQKTKQTKKTNIYTAREKVNRHNIYKKQMSRKLPTRRVCVHFFFTLYIQYAEGVVQFCRRYPRCRQ